MNRSVYDPSQEDDANVDNHTPSAVQKEEEKEMSFLDHLEELRWHLMRAIISIFVFALIAFLNPQIVFGTIILGPSEVTFATYQWLCQLSELVQLKVLCIEKLSFVIQNRKLPGQFAMHLVSSGVIGLVCAFPYAFWEIWRFIKPGLYPNEIKASRGATFFVSLLFITGVLFGYYIVSPLAINFLSNYQVDPSIINEIDLSSYVSTLIMMVLACGLIFQLPMVVYFLSKAGIVTPELMKQYRKHALVVILIVSAIITPPDPITQLFIAFPVFMLYQASIHIAKVVQRASSI